MAWRGVATGNLLSLHESTAQTRPTRPDQAGAGHCLLSTSPSLCAICLSTSTSTSTSTAAKQSRGCARRLGEGMDFAVADSGSGSFEGDQIRLVPGKGFYTCAWTCATMVARSSLVAVMIVCICTCILVKLERSRTGRLSSPTG